MLLKTYTILQLEIVFDCMIGKALLPITSTSLVDEEDIDIIEISSSLVDKDEDDDEDEDEQTVSSNLIFCSIFSM